MLCGKWTFKVSSWSGDVVQLVERLPRMYKHLGSIPNPQDCIQVGRACLLPQDLESKRERDRGSCHSVIQ